MSILPQSSEKTGIDLQHAARAWLCRMNIPAGIQQWVEFHQSPVSMMHPKRWEYAGPIEHSFILQSFYARAYIDNYFRTHWKWEAGAWTDLKNPLMRLAISDADFLSRLAVFSGAFIAAEEIRKSVDRKTVQDLRNGLGDEALQFARLQAHRLNVMIPKKCRLQTWLPSHATTIVINAGWSLIACASALLPATEWRQFLSRVPQAVEETWNQYEFSLEDYQASWHCLQALWETVKKRG